MEMQRWISRDGNTVTEPRCQPYDIRYNVRGDSGTRMNLVLFQLTEAYILGLKGRMEEARNRTT